MIRSVRELDTAAVVELAVVSGLFADADTGPISGLMADYFAGRHDEGHQCVIDDDDDHAIGVAYVQPVPATDRTWTLVLLAIRRSHQGQGRGALLLRHVEDQLRRQGQRLLLVETSGVAGFARTRAFYDKRGYTAEARVRDYYETGDDMVLYRRDLTATVPDSPSAVRDNDLRTPSTIPGLA